ncbi:MAG TPA: hypothetical protein ENJ54_00115 [Chloroflexi bacterium]|nr:hypothetical protein [Chloroflexota bacterium]
MGVVRLALLAVGGLLLAVAAVQDIRQREVDGWVLVGLLAAGVVYRLTMGGSAPWLWALGWLIVGFVARMGGADAKALAAIALYRPQASLAAWVGMAAWFVAWRLVVHDRRAPALPGALVGAVFFSFVHLLTAARSCYKIKAWRTTLGVVRLLF